MRWGRQAAELVRGPYQWFDGLSPIESGFYAERAQNRYGPGRAIDGVGQTAWNLLTAFRAQPDVEHAFRLLLSRQKADPYTYHRSPFVGGDGPDFAAPKRTRKQQRRWAAFQASRFWDGSLVNSLFQARPTHAYSAHRNYFWPVASSPEQRALRDWLREMHSIIQPTLAWGHVSAHYFRPNIGLMNVQWLMRETRHVLNEPHDLSPLRTVMFAAGEPRSEGPNYAVVRRAHEVHRAGEESPEPTEHNRKVAQAWQQFYEALPVISEWSNAMGIRLGGMHWYEARQRALAWHRAAMKATKAQTVAEAARAHRLRMERQHEMVKADFGCGWKLWKLTAGDKGEFEYEAAVLKHCVRGYHNNDRIYSLRLDGRPKVTFEVSGTGAGRYLNQAKSYRNTRAGFASWETLRTLQGIKLEERTVGDWQAAEIAPGAFDALAAALDWFEAKGIRAAIQDTNEANQWRKRAKGGQAARFPITAPELHWTETPGGLPYKAAVKLIKTKGRKGKLSARPVTLIQREGWIDVVIQRQVAVRIYPRYWQLDLWHLSTYSLKLTPAKAARLDRLDRGKPSNVKLTVRPMIEDAMHLLARAAGKVGSARPGDWVVWRIPELSERPYTGCRPYAEIDARGVVRRMYWDDEG